MHNYKAISHDASSFFSGKTTSGAQIDGREVDLSQLKPEELTKALQEFEVGYAQLQREAKTDPQAMQKLKEVNEKLCGDFADGAKKFSEEKKANPQTKRLSEKEKNENARKKLDDKVKSLGK